MALLKRDLVGVLARRLKSPPHGVQIVVGPRQVGKTTAVEQVLKAWRGPSVYASADLPAPPDAFWIQSQWQSARQLSKSRNKTVVLALDEVQKVPRWAEVVKACFDQDRRERTDVRAIILGSASLHVQKHARESLAGRFELHYCPHWSWPECRRAFRWSLDHWIFYGGYPGAAPLAREPERWRRYISSSLVEAVISRDVLQLSPVTKPALLRQLYRLATHHPAQMLSYNKMLGQLQDAGNTVTLAHYLELLSSAYLVSGLNLWSGGVARQRAASPKLVTWNNALLTSWPGLAYQTVRNSADHWGRLVENAVGGYLVNQLPGEPVYYWRDGDQEVDYVLERAGRVLALEVKSGRPGRLSGLMAFQKRFPKAKALVVGSGGIPLEQFFSAPPGDWFDA